VVQRHPHTTFIAAHMANDAEDLRELAGWLDQYPNLFVELASRISELGRQPYTARRFLIRYSDRVLFGTDGPWPEPRLRLYWRFLETFDENFPYSEKEFPPQGLWNIYGIQLPDDVLRRIYHENAARIIPGVKERLQAQQR
jgi:predicted TIM-barrel fold metal-dependent hydrolase